MSIMTLGNMKAKIEFDQDAELFRGEIPGLTGSADFYGKTVAELKCEFKKSLEVYLDECTRRRIEPYKSYSGKFVARIGPDIHEMISIAAADEDKTLNAWVKNALKQAVHSSESTENLHPSRFRTSL